MLDIDKGFIKMLQQDFRSIIICGHKNPDGDCIGAALALGLAMKKQGKEVRVLLAPYSERYSVIPGKELIYHGRQEELKADALIALDSSSRDMVYAEDVLWDKIPLRINIDHHESNTEYADINMVYVAPSASEVVCEIIEQMLPLDAEMSAAVYAGIINDTGGFKHPNTESSTHRKAAELIEKGIPFTEIYTSLLSLRTPSEIKILAIALQNLKILADCPFSYATVSKKEMEAAGVSEQNLGGIIENIFNVKGVEAAAFFSERASGIKVSFRSKGEINVARLAKNFGGGGHKNAAGCTISAPLEEAEEAVLSKVKELFI